MYPRNNEILKNPDSCENIQLGRFFFEEGDTAAIFPQDIMSFNDL